MDVTIGIATIGRPSLAETLNSLARQQLGDGLSMEIVIADDGDGSVVPGIVDSVDTDIPTRIVAVGMGNVAIARNACLDHARGEIILFVDDDEVAPPDWVDGLWGQVAKTGADCLFAPVNPVFAPAAPDWLVRLNPLYPDAVQTGRRGGEVMGRTGNSAIRLDFIRSHGIRFDPNYARHGEDLFFFAECASAGAIMRTAPRPTIDEHVREACHHLSYVCRALYGRGHVYADVRCRLDGHPLRTRTWFAVSGAVRVSASALALPVMALGGRTLMARGLFRLALETGKLARAIAGPKARRDGSSRSEAVAAPGRSPRPDHVQRRTALRSADRKAG